jgi:hypothetical protein
MSLALGKRAAPPKRDDPTIDLLIKRGQEHEACYVDQLRTKGKTVFDAQGFGSNDTAAEKIERTRGAMREGVDIIVQGALGDDRWFGIADIIHRVGTTSALGEWSYEVTDTKLTSETKAGTILQLALYSSLVGEIQGLTPERFHVVTPNTDNTDNTGSTDGIGAPVSASSVFSVLSVFFNDYAAYYRLMQRRMLESVALGDEVLAEQYYPEPVDHCGVCRWWGTCSDKRHADDHASLVAGVTRVQRRELAAHGAPTLTAIAHLPDPIPFKPRRGSKHSYGRVQRQAAVQLDSRGQDVPLHRLRELEDGRGLMRLPEPSPGDIFLDLEGDLLRARARPGVPVWRRDHRRWRAAVPCLLGIRRPRGAPRLRGGHGSDRTSLVRARGDARLSLRSLRALGVQAAHGPLCVARGAARPAPQGAALCRPLCRGARVDASAWKYSIKNLEPSTASGERSSCARPAGTFA